MLLKKAVEGPASLGGERISYVDGTDKVFADIARWNGALTPEQVKRLLEDGRAVYTNFSRWERA